MPSRRRSAYAAPLLITCAAHPHALRSPQRDAPPTAWPPTGKRVFELITHGSTREYRGRTGTASCPIAIKTGWHGHLTVRGRRVASHPPLRLAVPVTDPFVGRRRENLTGVGGQRHRKWMKRTPPKGHASGSSAGVCPALPFRARFERLGCATRCCLGSEDEAFAVDEVLGDDSGAAPQPASPGDNPHRQSAKDEPAEPTAHGAPPINRPSTQGLVWTVAVKASADVARRYCHPGVA